MDKQLFYRIDNGDTEIICELSGCMAMIEGESPTKESAEDDMVWTISPIWLTIEEFNNLPESD